jgi:hypothetical protein
MSTGKGKAPAAGRCRMTPIPAEGLTTEQAVQAWERIEASEAGQAGLRDAVPDCSAELARRIVPLQRPAFTTEELTSTGAEAAAGKASQEPAVRTVPRREAGKTRRPSAARRRRRSSPPPDRKATAPLAITASAAGLTGTMADFDVGDG